MEGLEDNPDDYYTGSYTTIFMSRNRKKNGVNRVLQFKFQEDKRRFIQQVLQWNMLEKRDISLVIR